MSISSGASSAMRDELHDLDPIDRLKLQLYADETDEDRAKKIFDALNQDIFLVRLRQLVWKQLQASNMNGDQFSNHNLNKAVVSILEENGFKDILRNSVLNIHDRANLNERKSKTSSLPTYARTSAYEPCDHVRQARMNWENGILEELKAIVQEAKRPFLLIREPGSSNLLLEQNSSNSNETVKFLFDSEDLMETIVSIRNPNLRAAQLDRNMGLIKLNVSTLDIERLSKRFPELHIAYSQLGLDETHANAQGFKLLAQRHEEGEAIIASGSISEARKFLRRGCPLSIRGRMWRIACGLHEKPTSLEEQHFLRLRRQCDRMDLVTDELFMHDVQTVLDDPRFFVFEEELKEVIFSFARDETIRQLAHYEIHAPFLQQMGVEYEKSSAPPCGIQPFLGLATYFAPLCYIYKDKVSLYHVSRYFFCNIWCRMNVISSSVEYDGTLIYVCKTFESLLIQSHPQLFLHLVNIGLPPLKVAFPWMQLGFVGFLEMEQILHLWERILGYMDTTLLAIAAVAIFMHRSEMLLRCSSEADAMMVLTEGSRLHIITLLQMFLLKDTRHA